MIEDDSGWFPDPDVEGQERFWDGTEWTDHVRPMEEEPESRALHEVGAEKDDEDDEVEVDEVEVDEAEDDALVEDDEVDEVELEEDEVEWAEDNALLEDESGWFPDPDVEGQERFWDGTEWTDHVRPVDEEPESRALHEVDAEVDDEDGEVDEVEVDEVEVEEDEVELEEDDALIEDESGWFPDPDVEGQERFWDGTEWTDHVRPMEEEPESRALHEVDGESEDDEVDEVDVEEDEVEGVDVEEDEVEGAEDDEFIDDNKVDEVNAEGDGVEVVKDEALLTERSEDDALIDDDESGWLPDPDVVGQERFWDGTEWTDQVRPVEEEPDFRPRLGIPDHVPELQRALAAATADIDDVEARLSTLFDRGAGKSKRGRGVSEPAGPGTGAAAAGPPIHEEFGGNPSTQAGGDPIHTGWAGAGGFSGDDDEAFAELDAALAAEEPEKAERRFFKRRS